MQWRNHWKTSAVQSELNYSRPKTTDYDTLVKKECFGTTGIVPVLQFRLGFVKSQLVIGQAAGTTIPVHW